ncbi:MAG TPA: phage holin family protein [Propionibacteriaceae bacterium]
MSNAYLDPQSTGRVPEERSIGEILTDVGQNVTTLLRQEVELAKAEAKQSASKAGKGLGMFAGAAVAGLMFLVFLSVGAWWALGTQIGNGWSGVIVAVVWAIIAGVLAFVGKKELDKIKGLPKTVETVGQIPNAAKGHEERN